MNEKFKHKRVEYQLCDKKQIYLLNGYRFKLKPELQGKPMHTKTKSRRFQVSPDSLTELATDVVRMFKLPEAFDWSSGNVQIWIESIGYAEYKDTFCRNHINGHTLILVDATALCRMNIKNHSHIRHIAKCIRKLYGTDTTKYFRNLFDPFSNLWTLYLQYIGSRAPNSQKINIIEFLRKYKILKPKYNAENHWNILETWLKNPKKFETSDQNVVGGTIRYNLYQRIHGVHNENKNKEVCLGHDSDLINRKLILHKENGFNSLVVRSLEYNRRIEMIEKEKMIKIVESSQKMRKFNECICDQDPCRCLSFSDICICKKSQKPKGFILSSQSTTTDNKQNRRLTININQIIPREKLLMVLPTLIDQEQE